MTRPANMTWEDYIRAGKTEEEQLKRNQEYNAAKLEWAEREENARFERGTWLDKMLDKWFSGKKKVKQKTAKQKSSEQVINHNNQKSR